MRKLTLELDRAFDVFISITYCLAVASTFGRLYRRRKVGKIWWDDCFALLSALGSIWLFVLFWMKALPPNSVLSTLAHSKARCWMGMLVSFSTLWFTRICLALGTCRIFPPQHLAHRLGLVSVGVFACFVASLLIAIIAQCTPVSAWDLGVGPTTLGVMCSIPLSTVYYSVVAGLIADAYLITVPVCALWNLKCSRSFRRMLISAFAASVIITATTIVIVVFYVIPASWEPLKSEVRLRISYLEPAISVILCNLIVLVSYAYSLRHGPSICGDGISGSTITQLSKTTPRLANPNSLSGVSFTDIDTSGDELGDEGVGTFGTTEWNSYDPETMQSVSR